MKPIIGILTNVMTVLEGNYAGGDRIYVNRDYVDCILEAGGIPLLLPILPDEKTIHAQIEHVDALLFSGGQDVAPHYYKEEPTPWLGALCPDRDHFEMEALSFAKKLKKPLLGVCRGMQILNVFFGGSLIQDIPQQLSESTLAHIQKEHRKEGSHTIALRPGSRLHSIVGQDSLLINSFHHQSVKGIAPGFQISATAPDGVIEAIEQPDHPFLLGVQWHPEMMRDNPATEKLFRAFVEAAKR